jgi:aminodeoxyfutalosine deaminase
MLTAGLDVTLNSDDPPMFGTDLIGEYHAAYAMDVAASDFIILVRNSGASHFSTSPPK